MNKPYSIDFRQPANTEELAPYLGLKPERLMKIVSSIDRREFYHHHRIPKKSPNRGGEFRDVWETGVLKHLDLVDVHKAFARRFELFLRLVVPEFPHKAAFGYVRNRGTFENASNHAGARLLLRADIHNFFPSVSASRLVDSFRKAGMKDDAAAALAKFATIDDKLPLGLNASPLLANLVCMELDDALQNLADGRGCRYSRYADDIAISGKSVPDRAEIEGALVAHGFSLNKRKFRVTKRGQAHFVTGLSISEKSGPRAPKAMKRRLRQELYYAEKFGVADHIDRLNQDPTVQSGINRLDGTVNYVRHIEKENGARFRSAWRKIVERDDAVPSYETRNERSGRFVRCYVDESEIAFQNRRFLAIGLAFTEDPGAIETSTLAVLRDFQVLDPFYAGDKKALAHNGIHFTDAHFELRAAYVKVLEILSFRAYLAFSELKPSDDYETKYLLLLQSLLTRRLIYYDGAAMEIIFEQNSKVKPQKLVEVVEMTYAELEAKNSRRPLASPDLATASKVDHPGFSVPDFLLAIFFRYAQSNEKPAEQLRIHQFERLRDKYRTIVDADTGIEYGRRKLFVPWSVG